MTFAPSGNTGLGSVVWQEYRTSTFADLRHTFTTRLQGLGVDYEVRQALLVDIACLERLPPILMAVLHGIKNCEAVAALDKAFKMSYGLSYERPAGKLVGANCLKMHEPAGTSNPGPSP